jgi:hypothetical protein
MVKYNLTDHVSQPYETTGNITILCAKSLVLGTTERIRFLT